MQQFATIGLPVPIIQSLDRLNIKIPTPIQEKAIPEAINGSDIIATAQTGSGKTLAYLLPILTKIENSAHHQALILAPTRELADQIARSIGQFKKRNQQSVALIIGGSSYFRQISTLKNRPQFIVGTPGRIIDLMDQGKLTLNNIKYFVLDEMDRMLDMGFSDDLEKISQAIPKDRQTLMFSATLPPAIAKYSLKYLKDPAKITIDSTTEAASAIKQSIIKVSTGEKFTRLCEALESREGSVIIFVKTKIGADNLASKLHQQGYKAQAIHGDLHQRKRERVIRSFRNGNTHILVATDIAARGIDIPHIKHVINYDLPQCPDDYIHRIGRTGRAGLEGFALSFVIPSEEYKWKHIHRMMSPTATKTKSKGSEPTFDRNKPNRHKNKRRFNKHKEQAQSAPYTKKPKQKARGISTPRTAPAR